MVSGYRRPPLLGLRLPVFGDREGTTQQAGRSLHTRFWPSVLPCGWLAWMVFGDRESTTQQAGRSSHTRFWPAVLPCGWLTGQMFYCWRSEPSRLA